MRGLARTAVTRWYTVISGLLLTAIAAALVFSLVPLNFHSSSTLVVMPAKRSGTQSTNPLLEMDFHLNTTAAILLESITSPLMSFRTGLKPGSDSVTAAYATNGGSSGANVGPFITITAQSPDALRAPSIVAWTVDLSREDLAGLQHRLRVPKRGSLTLESVSAPTPASPIWFGPVAATTSAVLLGLVLTGAVAYGLDRADRRRGTSGLASSVPYEGVGRRPVNLPYPPIVVPVRPAASYSGDLEKVG